jgi:hypothetical protein
MRYQDIYACLYFTPLLFSNSVFEIEILISSKVINYNDILNCVKNLKKEGQTPPKIPNVAKLGLIDPDHGLYD